MISEALASFVFIFLFMLCTDKKTQYSDDKVINCFIMSASYCAARLMGGGGLVTVVNEAFYQYTPAVGDVEEIYGDTLIYQQPRRIGPLLNPAIAVGNMIWAGKFDYFLIYPVMPFLGSVGALVFYEYIFVKSQEYLEGDDDSKNSDDLSMDSE
jgi:glycerol uptake facilitator-like aquaporin